MSSFTLHAALLFRQKSFWYEKISIKSSVTKLENVMSLQVIHIDKEVGQLHWLMTELSLTNITYFLFSVASFKNLSSTNAQRFSYIHLMFCFIIQIVIV